MGQEVKGPIKVVKREERTRSEYMLLWELVQRNPKKAAEFLRRLGESVRASENVLDEPQDMVSNS